MLFDQLLTDFIKESCSDGKLRIYSSVLFILCHLLE